VIAKQKSWIFITEQDCEKHIQTTPHQVQSAESNARSKILQISDNALEIGMAVA
jgi:hypothetical protein